MEAIPVKGKIEFIIPAKMYSGQVGVTKNQEGVGQLAVIVESHDDAGLVTFVFLDKSMGGDKRVTHFMCAAIRTEAGSLFYVTTTDENLLQLIDLFEHKIEVGGFLTVRQDVQTFDMYYIADITLP